MESSLLKALEKESETLQNITDQFAPLMANFRVFFFWEQEKTDLKYTKDYIVDEASAAPILDNTERCGIASDHRGMVKFGKGSSQGFRTTVAALRRYCQEAPYIIRGRWIKAAEALNKSRRQEAMEILNSIQLSLAYIPATEIAKRVEMLPAKTQSEDRQGKVMERLTDVQSSPDYHDATNIMKGSEDLPVRALSER